MADTQDENLEFEQLDLPGDDLGETDPLAELEAPGDTDAVLPVDEPETVELPEPEAEEAQQPEEPEEKEGLLQAVLGKIDRFTAMLALALLAILMAIGCLVVELARYNFEIKPPGY